MSGDRPLEGTGVGEAVTCCPACGGSDSVQVGDEATAFDSLIGGRHFYQPAYSIRICSACALYFKSHTLPLEQLDDLYARLASATYDVDGRFPTDQIVRTALGRLPSGSTVLDFGCSTGRILKHHTARLACFGVEPNRAAATAARSAGICIATEADLRDGRCGSFDAIVLADVYEHLPRPLPVLQMLAGLLKPHGWLAIVTGNADAIVRRRTMGEFWYFRWPGHLHMLSERHVTWLATKLGLEVAALERCSHYVHPLRERLRQYVSSSAYHQFQESPRGAMSAVLRMIPRVRRAERWSNAPALTYGADHVVAFLHRQAAVLNERPTR